MNIIFDFDGTIADSLDVILGYANDLLQKQNQPPVAKEEFQKKGLKGIIKSRKISKIRLYIYVIIARRNLASHIQQVKPFAELTVQIKKLSKNNTLGIITSSSEQAVKNFLKLYKLDKYFDFLQSEFGLFSKDQKIKKAINQYHLDARQTIYIGDETRDIQAAKKAGIKSIAVAWGFEGSKLIKKAKPNFIATKPEQLISLIKKMSADN